MRKARGFAAALRCRRSVHQVDRMRFAALLVNTPWM